LNSQYATEFDFLIHYEFLKLIRMCEEFLVS